MTLHGLHPLSLTQSPPGINAQRSRRSQTQLIFVMVLAFSYTTLPTLVNLLLAGRTGASQESSGAVNTTSLGSTLESTIMPATLIIGCLVLALANFRQLGRMPYPVMLVLAYWAIALTVSSIATADFSAGNKWFAVPMLILALWSIRLRAGDLHIIGYLTALLAFCSLGFTLISDKPWMVLTPYLQETNKALIGENLLAGPFAQMNILGMCLAMGLPFVFLIKLILLRYISLGLVVAALLFTGARTSLIAAVIMLAVGFFVLLARATSSKKLLLGTALLTLAIAGISLPLLVQDPEAFTNRGAIWQASKDQWSGQLMFGNGLRAYTENSPISNAIGYPSWHGHNFFLSNMTMGGIALVGGAIAMIVASVRVAFTGLQHTSVFALSLVTVLAISMAEVPLRIDDFDGASWMTWSVLIAIASLDTDWQKEATL